MTIDGPSAKLLIACYHEAGHALVADREGVPLEAVHAKESGTGRVKPVDIDRAHPMSVLRIAHAGVAAERVGLGHDQARLHVDDDDGKLAFHAKTKITGNHFKLDEEVIEYVEDTLRTHSEELQALATFMCARANTVIPWSHIQVELNGLRGVPDS